MTTTHAPLTTLSLNTGSSSLKFGVHRVSATSIEELFEGEAESIGAATSAFWLRGAGGATLLSEHLTLTDQHAAFTRFARLFAEGRIPRPDTIGHRVVHGGAGVRAHCLIDDVVMKQLEAAAVLAPLHVPAALSVIRFAAELFPGVPQVACLDTAFHAGMPDVARMLPLPKELRALGVERYGFHGLSCESILRQLGDAAPSRLVIAHLGSGASVTAVANGKSIDTSMGMTPSGGLVMGTRCGDLDPGVLLYLMREQGLDADALEVLLDRRSGMLGVSCLDSDMRRLRAAASTNADARLAIDMFCRSVRQHIAAKIASLGGIDLLVFTGGIGERDAEARAQICEGLAWCGIAIDPARNRDPARPIESPASQCRIRVLPSQEELEIARHAASFVRPA